MQWNSGTRYVFTFDPLGSRIHKSGTGVTNTWFLNDGDDEVVEYNSNKDVVAIYVPGPAIDEPIAMVTPNGNGTYSRKYFHTNHQGSVIAMSDDAGAKVEGPFLYGPYGNCFQGTTPCAQLGSSVPYKFTSRRLDPETELYYDRARYYWAPGGRFLQTDPVGYTADLNLYTYVGNDPIGRTDPTGSEWGAGCHSWSAGLGCGGLGVGGGCNASAGPCPLQHNDKADKSDDAAAAASTGSEIQLAQLRPVGPRGAPTTTNEEFRVEEYNRILQEVYRYDPGYTQVRSHSSIPSNEELEQIGQYRDKLVRTSEYFSRRGIGFENPHGVASIAGRGSRGVTPQSVIRAYNQGRTFYDPTSGWYVRRDSRTGVHVILTDSSGGRIVSAMEGDILSRWHSVPFRY